MLEPFAVIAVLVSIVIAYRRKIIKEQLIAIGALLLLWYLAFIAKAGAARLGINADRLGILAGTLVELTITIIYPYVIAPLAALLFAVFFKRKSKA